MGRAGRPAAGGGATTFREIERKVRVPEAFVLPRLAGVVPGIAEAVAGEPILLLAAYHDTADLRLIRWGATLRRREGGPDAGWHLKLPVEGEAHGVRDELGLPLSAGPVGEVPEEFLHLLTPLTRGAALVHVATVRTRRLPVTLLGDDGEAVAEVVDDHVEVLGGGNEVLGRFHEIEVEAKAPGDDGAPPAALDEVVALLLAAGGEEGSVGKAAAALGERAGGPPDVVVPPWPGPADPAAEAIHAVLATHIRKFLLQDVRVRRDLPDSVHQMRVAARTLRSALRTFAPFLDERWTDRLRKDLRRTADGLGGARDTEVQRARLLKHAAELPEPAAGRAAAAVGADLDKRLAQARAAALDELRGKRHRRLLDELVAAAREPRLLLEATRPAGEALSSPVEEAWQELAEAAEGLEPDGRAEDWHRARILAKRARYAAEAVAPVLGRDAAARGEALERVTDLLGDLHDAFVAQETLGRLARRKQVGKKTRRALAELAAAEAKLERSDREAFAALWPEVLRVHRDHPFG